MSIRARLLLLVGGFAALAAAIVALALITLGDYNRMLTRFDRAYVNAWQGERFNHLVSRAVMESRGIYAARNRDEAALFASNLNGVLDETEALITHWQAGATPDEMARLQPLTETAAGFIALRREVARHGMAGDSRAAEALGIGNRPARIAFQTELDRMVTQTRAELDSARAKVETYSRHRASGFLLTAVAGTALILALTLWMVSVFISAPLRALAAAIIRTSKGDYDVRLNAGSGRTEMASVWRALDILRQRAREAERLAAEQREAERREELKLREILLD